MNINGIGNTISIDTLSALNGASNDDPSAEAVQTSATPAASTTLSKPGELMSKLNQLLSRDPAQFKAVTQQISDELKTAAEGASGPQASLLSKLADNFAQASSSGSLSSLQPAQGSSNGVSAHHHRHGGGHHGGGAGGGIAAVLSTALEQVNQALSGTTDGAAARTSE